MGVSGVSESQTVNCTIAKKHTDIMILSFLWLGQALSMKTKIDFQIFQEWGDALESVWPDITVEEKASWTDVGLTFKMRRRYRKFLLLYYVPRYSSLFLDPTIAS